MLLFVIIFVVSVLSASALNAGRIKGVRLQNKQSTRLFGFMDALNKAMANENLGPAPNAGLSKDAPTMDEEFIGNKKAKVTAYAGQKISMVANAARVPIKYNCKAGDCGTCEVNLDGKIVKACQAVLPNKKSVKIQPLK